MLYRVSTFAILLLSLLKWSTSEKFYSANEVSNFKIGDPPKFDSELTPNVEFLTIDGEIPSRTFVNIPLTTYMKIRPNVTYIQPNAFASLGKLIHLDISGNKVRYLLNSTFIGAKHLKTLNVAANRINYIEMHTFLGLKELEDLDLSQNPDLKVLRRNVFLNLRSLKKLNLRNCGITSIEINAFTGLDNLRELDLTENHLTAVYGYNLDNLPSLESLNLSGNEMTDVDTKGFKSYLLHLRRLNIANNKIKCDVAKQVQLNYMHQVQVVIREHLKLACIS